MTSPSAGTGDPGRPNGNTLGWLIDPYEARIYFYRPSEAVLCLESPTIISGDPVLPGFVFNLEQIW